MTIYSSIPLTYKPVPKNSNGDVNVSIQDQTTLLVSGVFAQSILGGNFSLATDTDMSTIDTLYYSFIAEPGHNIVINDNILLLDRIANRSLQAKVISVDTNTITIDKPIDHIFPASGPLPTLGRRTIVDITIDGSTTPQIFSIRAGSIPLDYKNYTFVFVHSTEGDDSKFCDIDPLPRGLVLRIVDGYQETLFNFKTNGDFKRFGARLETNEKSGGGSFSTSIILPVSEIFGVVQRIREDSVIQIIVQDDLTNLTSGYATALGHQTLDEI